MPISPSSFCFSCLSFCGSSFSVRVFGKKIVRFSFAGSFDITNMCRHSSVLRPLRKASSTFAKRSSRAVQVVSFDATDTMIANGEPFNDVYSRVAFDHGVNVHPAVIASAFPKYMSSLSASYPCFGFNTIGPFEWWKRIVVGCLQEGSSVQVDREKGEKIAQRLFDFYATARAWRITDPKLRSVLNQLRQNGVGVVVVSNSDARLRTILEDFNLYSLFDVVVASGEVGVEKPSPQIFEMVLNHYHLSDASQLLHIGDNLKKDYLAARDFGANALLFDPHSTNQDLSDAEKISSFSELKVE
ncbi:hypothetical protein RB195_009456 [Necator americanus]